MTTHTYAGCTAEQIRAAAEAATPSSEWQFEHRNVEIKFRVRSGIQALFPLSRCHNVLNAEVRANVAHIEMCQPATVLALLDHITELERRVVTVEGWHFTETSRADELQESIYGDRDEIAGLRARIAELEPDAERYRWIRDKERFHIDGECGDATLPSRMCCAEEVDTAIDAARAQPAV
ncbi:hypothetical protein [Microvirgula aerodenitrificans]|uniref:hypothetical protein n=1 Tax=Microvirgula aerodenitrificans TaxID=57480 RepID=UPI00248E2E14|nr:hypothetical protein [Microvirgula aerodenitrificans]